MLFLLPIFLLFILMHVVGITLGVVARAADMPALVANSYQEVTRDVQGLGWFVTLGILLHAYSLGGGTYIGIEAVSNGLQILREPRVATGRKTMLYMATSLAFTASGILLGYLLNRVVHQPGMTLNASLFSTIYGNFLGVDATLTSILVIVTLITEAALLIVAAQAGFLDGPRVLSNMSLDSWAPHRLSHLSDRLVTRNGVWFMGLASLAFLLYSHGNVKLLVVMYSINVFLTFTLSQSGMCRHWWEARKSAEPWRLKLAINGLGLVATSTILFVTVTTKFTEGGWVTIGVTLVFVALCQVVRWHYDRVKQAVKRLDETLLGIPFQPDLNAPTPVKNPG
ncbi:MAG: amino acid transporter, partial [Candidatus Binatia bacterium]